MSEYIKREDVLKSRISVLEHIHGIAHTMFVVTVQDINDVPAADVEPVVRCKDCVNSRDLYGDGLESVYNEMWCEDQDRIVQENGYCDCGARRGDI